MWVEFRFYRWTVLKLKQKYADSTSSLCTWKMHCQVYISHVRMGSGMWPSKGCAVTNVKTQLRLELLCLNTWEFSGPKKVPLNVTLLRAIHKCFAHDHQQSWSTADVPGEPSPFSVAALELRGGNHYLRSWLSAEHSQWKVRQMTDNNHEQTASLHLPQFRFPGLISKLLKR